MKIYGVDMIGDFNVKTVTSLPTWAAVNEGDLIYNSTDGKFYYGSSSAWKQPEYNTFRNKIINGNFDVWERGTSFSISNTYAYTADRWKMLAQNGANVEVTREEFTPGQTDVPDEPTYYISCDATTGYANNEGIGYVQNIKDVQTFAGKTVTVSFYAKADSAKDICLETIQNFGSGGSSYVYLSPVTFSLTSSWARYTTTFVVPSIAGKTINNDNDNLIFAFWLSSGSDNDARTNSLGNQSGVFDLSKVQIEEGSVASDFEDRPLAVELDLCRRYFERIVTYIGADETEKIWFSKKVFTPTITDNTGGTTANTNDTNCNITDTTSSGQDHTIDIDGDF